MMELIERRVVASQKVGVRLYFSQIDLVILILVPVRRNDQPLVLMGIRDLLVVHRCVSCSLVGRWSLAFVFWRGGVPVTVVPRE